MSTNSDNKLFEFAREVNHYCELRPDSELAKIKVVPSYILVGDQSSGKTSLLSRLARMPLGYTANKTGTRRPVEYNLIHDPSKREPDIEVNSKKVAVEDFLKVMIEENGTEGFRDSAVSVKILWRDIPESVIVADMPGMKDGDTAPENMILKRLRNANVIPVVILEPKDFDSKHFAFDLLKRAGRSYSDIIAVVNKCDEKMAEKGQWSNQSDWTDFWETANKKGFKKICITGWPCSSSDRNNPDLEKQKRALGESCEQENNLIQEWKRRVNVCAEALECVGLVVLAWAREASQLLDGKVDVHVFTFASKAHEDVHWLASDGLRRFDQLPSHTLHRSSTKSLLEGLTKGSFFNLSISDREGLPDNASWINAISYSIFVADVPLLGKAAFERTLDIVFTAALCRNFQHALMEFDIKFINNILAENSEDSGNKVIQQFVKRVLAVSLHPMVDVFSLLIWKHLEKCFTKSYKPWPRDSDSLKDTRLEDFFDSAAELNAQKLVQELNKELHDDLVMNGNQLQAKCRDGKNNSSVANNLSGNTFPDTEDHCKYNDLSEADFCSTASSFLQNGMDVLQKASDKCRQTTGFYELLQAAALGLNSEGSKKQDLDVKNVFLGRTQIHAIETGQVEKARSRPLHIASGKTITVVLDVQSEENSSFDEDGKLAEGEAGSSQLRSRKMGLGQVLLACLPPAASFFAKGISSGAEKAKATPSEKSSVVVGMIDQRSDVKMLNTLFKPKAAFCVVALNDYRQGKWLTSQTPKNLAAGHNHVELAFQAEYLEKEPLDVDKLVAIDILCRNVKVVIKSVKICTNRAPETTADSEISEIQSDDEEKVKTGANEVMKTAVKLMTHMKSNFKPLQGFQSSGPRMDFRKLFEDLSCELVEQTISFRELLQKRLEKSKLTAKDDLGTKVTLAAAAAGVLDTICDGNKKKIRKNEKYAKILRKALDLHHQYTNPDAHADSDSD